MPFGPRTLSALGFTLVEMRLNSCRRSPALLLALLLLQQAVFSAGADATAMSGAKTGLPADFGAAAGAAGRIAPVSCDSPGLRIAAGLGGALAAPAPAPAVAAIAIGPSIAIAAAPGLVAAEGARSASRQVLEDGAESSARAVTDDSRQAALDKVYSGSRELTGGDPVAPDLFFDGRRFADAVAAQIAARKISFHTLKPRRNVHVLDHLYRGSAWESIGYDLEVKNPASLPETKTDQLYVWLLAQPEHSVAPDALFVKALDVSGGSVWDALAIGWDVLSQGSEAGDRERNFLPKTLRLADIRGDIKLLPKVHDLGNPNYRWTSQADNFSAWYHLWGTMLYAFYRDSGFVRVPLPGHWVAKVMILLEESVGGPVLEWIPNGEWRAFLDFPKRLETDVQGAVAGSRLAANLKALRKGKINRLETSRGGYLIQRPWWKRLIITAKELLPVVVMGGVIVRIVAANPYGMLVLTYLFFLSGFIVLCYLLPSLKRMGKAQP